MIEQINENPQRNGNQQLIEHLTRAVLEQKLCNDILSFKYSLVNQIKTLIIQTNQRLEEFELMPSQNISTNDKNFRFQIYRMDIQRVDYLLKTYLRTRLIKIQKYSFYIIKDNVVDKLSPEEQEFVAGYSKLRYNVYNNNVLKDLHKDFKHLGGMESIFDNNPPGKKDASKQSTVDLVSPNKNGFGFFKFISNPDELRYGLDIQIKNGDKDDRSLISENDIVLMSYNKALPLFEKNQVTML